MPLKQTRSAISYDIKKEICEYIKENSNVTQGNVAMYFNEKYEELNINRTTICKIWKEKEKWLAVLTTSQTSNIFQNKTCSISRS